ncbi:cytochrome c biogenesis protein CcsA [Bacteroides caecicola]|uniref:Cytochrome c biogenesis protein CcsA n=1 Tax=Bacteroides caecicola TaxID=1462569 RepID=A0ABS2F800_9BACE|nr:cytochrome c biogenesis protein CcsA [Bacteroides caecicola]MBM6806365.1 cytochrome c biogenesis protein CcsA [Bacteroides caecicola]
MKLLKIVSFGGIGILLVVLITATILEKLYGTSFSSRYIYHSYGFVGLWGIAAVAGIAYTLKRKLYRFPITFSLHLSLALILTGAMVTFLFGRQGNIHLRINSPAQQMFCDEKGDSIPLPFRIKLNGFRIDYYPGTQAPMDYVSQLTVTDGSLDDNGTVSMNNIYTYRHYRFYQSAYDPDGNGVTLAVSHDPYGIGITYAGYALLTLSFLLFFFVPDSGFRKLLRHPLLRKGTVTATMIVLGCLPAVSAETNRPNVLPPNVADAFGNLYVYYNDRICPLQTLARDFTMKLYGKSVYKGLTAEQVLTGWLFYYDDWKNEPIIRIKSKDVQQRLGITGYARLTDFIGKEGYKLKETRRSNAPALREAKEADEKFNLISMAATGSLFKIYPYRPTNNEPMTWISMVDQQPQGMAPDQWLFIRKSIGLIAEQIVRNNNKQALFFIGKIKKYQEKEAADILPSPLKFKAEKLYNMLRHTRPVAMVCLSIGIISFILCCRSMSRRKRINPILRTVLLALLGGIGVYLLAVICLRGYVSGHLPLSNGFETMQFMAVCVILLTFICCRRFEAVIAFGYMLGGLALLVSMLGEANPPITQLMPVLASPLLSIHVVTIMIAYSLLAFAMMNGITALLLSRSHHDCTEQIARLEVISRLLLYPAVCCLALGIFIGAVWANVSWGRYWGWDPKEVWALITMLIYASALHPASLPFFRRPMFFHWFCVIAFASVLITYFGVNFIMGGMHSYA